MDPAELFNSGNVRVKKCRHGVFAYFVNDFYIGRSLDIYGEYCEEEAKVFQQIVRPGMTAIEVGANIGTHTVVLARALGSTGQLIVFEPQRTIYHLLCTNICLNNLMNVATYQAAAGRLCGSTRVPYLNYFDDNNFGGIELGKSPDGMTVPVIALDSLGLAQCDFIKIDVEGMELEVLHGAQATIDRFRPILYLENDRKEHSRDLFEHLTRCRYRLYWHVSNLFNPVNFYGTRSNHFDGVVSVNMIGIPVEAPSDVTGFSEITSIENCTWPI